MASRFQQRFAELDTPDSLTDEEEIWSLIRFSLVISRVVLFVAIILISEVMESYFIYDLSLAIWSLIIGIPLFLLLSLSIILGDKIMTNEEITPVETAVLRPIRERI